MYIRRETTCEYTGHFIALEKVSCRFNRSHISSASTLRPSVILLRERSRRFVELLAWTTPAIPSPGRFVRNRYAANLPPAGNLPRSTLVQVAPVASLRVHFQDTEASPLKSPGFSPGLWIKASSRSLARYNPPLNPASYLPPSFA